MPDRDMIKESTIRAVRNGAKNEELRLIIDELLEAQEPVEAIRIRAGLYRCGICGMFLYVPPYKFCPCCGRKVNW